MKRINSLWGLLLLWSVLLQAQDVQTLYDQAKETLAAGKYELALSMIADAKADIAKDAKLDPNHVFAKRLLPQLEKNAQNMADAAKALDQLYQNVLNSLAFPDLAPGPDAVQQYNDQAKQASRDLLSKRDEIMAQYVLEPEFRDVLRKLPAFTQIEELAGSGIMDKLAGKFSQMAGVLMDSLKNVDGRFRKVQDKLAHMIKSASANKGEIERLTKEVNRLSAERITYVNTISEMLAGEPGPENAQLRTALMDNQVENVFAGMIQSEINRLSGIAEVDSAGYKELMKGYDRVKSYNRIFTKNKIAADQQALLAQYEAALKAVKIKVPEKPKSYTMLIFGGALLLAIVVVIVMAVGKRKKTAGPIVR
jgi:archaellum component FlaC